HYQQHEDQGDRDRDQDQEMAPGPVEVLKHAEPAHAIAIGHLYRFVEPFLGLRDKAALVAAGDVAAHSDAPPAILAGDECLTVNYSNGSHLGQRHRHTRAAVDRQIADGRWGFQEGTAELGHDIESPLALVERANRLTAQGDVDQPIDVLDLDVVAGTQGPIRL